MVERIPTFPGCFRLRTEQQKNKRQQQSHARSLIRLEQTYQEAQEALRNVVL